MTLALTTAGESHGRRSSHPDRPAGRARARPRRHRRRPPSPPAGLRPQSAPAARAGPGRGARRPPPRAHAGDAARARRPQPRPQELGVGDASVAARGRAVREGDEAGDAAAARPRRPRRRAQVRPRGRPRRARARERGTRRSTSPPARSAALRELGIGVEGSVLEIGGEREGWEAAIDAARADRDTLGGVVEVRATGVFRGSAPTRRARSGSTRASPR